jgi:hypothetical protein
MSLERAAVRCVCRQQIVGVIKAKPEGTPLSRIEWQLAVNADILARSAANKDDVPLLDVTRNATA